MLAGCECLKSMPVETGNAASLRRTYADGSALHIALDTRQVLGEAHREVDHPNMTDIEKAPDSSRNFRAVSVFDGWGIVKFFVSHARCERDQTKPAGLEGSVFLAQTGILHSDSLKITLNVCLGQLISGRESQPVRLHILIQFKAGQETQLGQVEVLRSSEISSSSNKHQQGRTPPHL